MPIFKWDGVAYTNLRTGATPGPGDAAFMPSSVADVNNARILTGAPADANYVTWNPDWTHLEQAFLAMSDNDILVLPEREEPYYIDSSNGFMAADVVEIDGVGPDGKKDGSRIPIVSNPRLWFAMCRARRGILGLGPGAVIEPSPSSFTQEAQPVLQDQVSGQQFQNRYMSNGSIGQINGVPNKLIETPHANPFFANFTMRSRSFGGVSYSAISMDGTGHKTVKRINFDGAWRGHAGVPNGETGALSILNGTYTFEGLTLTPVNATSPIMWNRTDGGSVKNARSTRPNVGMWTFWRCGGVNTFENVYLDSRQTGINIEENEAGFELDWTVGTFTLDYTGNKFHFAINPVDGPPKISLHGVEPSTNAYTPGSLTLNVYSTYGVAKRSFITCDTLPVSCVPEAAWIN